MHSIIAIVVKAKNKDEAKTKATEALDSSLVADHYGFFDWYDDIDSKQVIKANSKNAKELVARLFETQKENQLFHLRKLRTMLDSYSDNELVNASGLGDCPNGEAWRYNAGTLGVNHTYRIFDEDGEIIATNEDLPQDLRNYFIVPVDTHH